MTPIPSRVRFTFGRDAVEATIPAARHGWMLFLLPLWLGGWLPMGWSIAGELAWPADVSDIGPLLFQLAWLAIWLVGSLWVAGALLWSAFGVERVRFARDHVALARQIAWFTLYRLYRPADVGGVRLCRSLRFAAAGPADAEQCRIAFDYRGRTVSFGAGMDEADALEFVRQIHARAPWCAL